MQASKAPTPKPSPAPTRGPRRAPTPHGGSLSSPRANAVSFTSGRASAHGPRAKRARELMASTALSRDAPKAPLPTARARGGTKHDTSRRHEPSYRPSVSPTPRPSHAPSYSPTVDPTLSRRPMTASFVFGKPLRRRRRRRRGAAAERTTPPSTREQHKRPRRIYPTSPRRRRRPGRRRRPRRALAGALLRADRGPHLRAHVPTRRPLFLKPTVRPRRWRDASTASRRRRGTPQKLRCRRERAMRRDGRTKHLTTATTQARTELRTHGLSDARAVPRAFI